MLMVKVIQSQINTQTVQGEITVNLNLTITLNQDGTLSVAETKKIEPDKVKYIIPDFQETELLSNFGEET